MLKAKLIAVLLSLRALFCPCEFSAPEERYRKSGQGRLPRQLYEASGLSLADSSNFWLIQDSGHPAQLSQITPEGELLSLLQLPLTNYDWEAVTTDLRGTVYIGDFGNNAQNRRNLRVFRYRLNGEQIDTISFYFPEQQAFPPPEKDQNFDCEAFYWQGGSLHLFTKAWGSRVVSHYTVPDSAGTFAARKLEGIKLKGLVTDAARHPVSGKVALLTYGKIYFFTPDSAGYLFTNPIRCEKLVGIGQAEALTFTSETDLFISNETGKLWSVRVTD